MSSTSAARGRPRTHPQQERTYRTPDGNRLNLAALLNRLEISRELFYLRQRERRWPGFRRGRIPSKKTPQGSENGRGKERTFLESDADLAKTLWRAARDFRSVKGAESPPIFVSGNETGWHDSGTYYGKNKDGVAGFFVTDAEVTTRYPSVRISRVCEYRREKPCSLVLDANGTPRKFHWIPVLPPWAPSGATKTPVTWLEDVNRLAEFRKARVAARFSPNMSADEIEATVFTNRDQIRWPTEAQCMAIHGVPEKYCEKWAREMSIRPEHQGQPALRKQDVPNPSLRGPHKVPGYNEGDLLGILEGNETKHHGTGTGHNADQLRVTARENAKNDLLEILPKGESLAPSEIFDRARKDYGLSPQSVRRAFHALSGVASSTARPGKKGLAHSWRLPPRAYKNAKPGAPNGTVNGQTINKDPAAPTSATVKTPPPSTTGEAYPDLGIEVDDAKRTVCGLSHTIGFQRSEVQWHIFSVAIAAYPEPATIEAMRDGYPGETNNTARKVSTNLLNKKLARIGVCVRGRQVIRIGKSQG